MNNPTDYHPAAPPAGGDVTNDDLDDIADKTPLGQAAENLIVLWENGFQIQQESIDELRRALEAEQAANRLAGQDNDIVAAKAIRAVVDRVIPERMNRGLGDIRAEFLAIATELENHP